jgi:hypothetical protein
MRKFLVLAFIFGSMLLAGHAWAANYSNPVDGIFKGAYGDTITVTVGSTDSKSPDASGLIGDLSFTVNSNTGYRNFNQLADLKAGDHVQVEYTEEPNGKMRKLMAYIITKINPPIVTRTTEVSNGYVVPVVATTNNAQTVTTTTTTTTVSNSEIPNP